MPSRSSLTILVGLAACTWAVVLLAVGIDVGLWFFKPLSAVIGVLAITLAAFDSVVWRWSWVRWAHGRPDLNGTWTGEIRSDWIDPDTGQGIGPIVASAVVRQSYSGVTLTMFTREMQSVTVAATLTQESNGHFAISGVYRSEPKLLIQERSRVHYGGLRLALGGEGESRLHGSYWTDRGTRGELDFSFVTRMPARDFESALGFDPRPMKKHESSS